MASESSDEISNEDFVMINDNSSPALRPPKSGRLYVEARLVDSLTEVQNEKPEVFLRDKLEKQLNSPDLTFEMLEDILATETRMYFDNFERTLESIKVVEYQGPPTELRCYQSNHINVIVHVYTLYNTPTQRDDKIPSGESTLLPHQKFEGVWDELVFDTEIKDELFWMMKNMLRFSQRANGQRNDTSPVILLYGPPGTGKTTLSQGLAQKVSIRMSSQYTRTILIQIKTAALLSKYFSESAKQVDSIFTTLHTMCEDDRLFVCVLIDEVESIAGSRENVMRSGESQDLLRATNALLTGLDRTKHLSNIVFLCTSNLFSSLDPAFVDRCGVKLAIQPPSLAAQYGILRMSIERLIARGNIHPPTTIPDYEEAQTESLVSEERSGSRLLSIVYLIHNGNIHARRGSQLSGRSLTQLPEGALLRYLRGDECDIDLALSLMDRFVRAEQNQEKRKKVANDMGLFKPKQIDSDNEEEIQRGRKRPRITVESSSRLTVDCDPKIMGKLVEVIMGVNEELDPEIVGNLMDDVGDEGTKKIDAKAEEE